MNIFSLIVYGPKKNLNEGVMAETAVKGPTLSEISLSILDIKRPILKPLLYTESS
jgi:hypothetical protein